MHTKKLLFYESTVACWYIRLSLDLVAPGPFKPSLKQFEFYLTYSTQTLKHSHIFFKFQYQGFFLLLLRFILNNNAPFYIFFYLHSRSHFKNRSVIYLRKLHSALLVSLLCLNNPPLTLHLFWGFLITHFLNNEFRCGKSCDP